MIVLVHVDPEKHMDRWYAVNVQPTLFDRYAVVCLWGSRRTGYQRKKAISVDTLEQAQGLADKIVGRKIRRGYQMLTEKMPPAPFWTGTYFTITKPKLRYPESWSPTQKTFDNN